MTKSKSFSSPEIAQSYNQRFKASGRLRESDAFYRWVLNHLEVNTKEALLDIACGEGNLGCLSIQRGLRTFSIDLSSVALASAKRNASENQISIADGQQLPFPSDMFDYVTNLGSLEHFYDPMMGLSEMHRILKPNGKAALLLPNSYYLIDIFWTVLRTGNPPSHEQLIERFATFREWQAIIEKAHFRIHKAHKYNFSFPKSIKDYHWYLERPRKILNLLVSPFIPFHLSYSFLFIVSRDPSQEI